MIMRRNISLALVGQMAVVLVSGARPVPTLRRVGMLLTSTQAYYPPYLSAFTRGMQAFGWEEGKNVTYRIVFANGDLTRVAGLASDLVRERVDVIVVAATPTVRAAREATRAIPIVFTALSNVVDNGFVMSLARPGGNVTGIASQFEEVLGKLIELLHAVAPVARRVAILVNENNLSSAAFWRAAQNACRVLDLVALRVVANSVTQFGVVVDDVAHLRAQAVVVSNDFLYLSERARLHEVIHATRLPSAYGYREHVATGGLLSYGSSILASFEQVATYVDKILKGAKAADLPVEQPTKFELVINLETARELGLTVPQSVLLRADEVIR
jgi:putative ABC transport system substrate-binding protein